jgi:hypothetical protein
MAIDLAALKAKIAAQKAATPAPAPATISENKNETSNSTSNNVVAGTSTDVANSSGTMGSTQSTEAIIPTVNAPDKLGTSKTSEIDHMDFLAKMNQLSEAIHKQHPTMPVLLMQIHKQLRSDPELVTTLDDAAIGIIVKGLQVQTKTELVVEAVKKTGGKSKKNPALSVDML